MSERGDRGGNTRKATSNTRISRRNILKGAAALGTAAGTGMLGIGDLGRMGGGGAALAPPAQPYTPHSYLRPQYSRSHHLRIRRMAL